MLIFIRLWALMGLLLSQSFVQTASSLNNRPHSLSLFSSPNHPSPYSHRLKRIVLANTTRCSFCLLMELPQRFPIFSCQSSVLYCKNWLIEICCSNLKARQIKSGVQRFFFFNVHSIPCLGSWQKSKERPLCRVWRCTPNQNYIHENIKFRLKAENSCHY